jgi:hypothetical protein
MDGRVVSPSKREKLNVTKTLKKRDAYCRQLHAALGGYLLI